MLFGSATVQDPCRAKKCVMWTWVQSNWKFQIDQYIVPTVAKELFYTIWNLMLD